MKDEVIFQIKSTTAHFGFDLSEVLPPGFALVPVILCQSVLVLVSNGGAERVRVSSHLFTADLFH